MRWDEPGTRRLNVEATCRLIDQLLERGIIPVFASSDAVFDGSRGSRTETDTPRPVLTYGKQKLEVENYLAQHAAKWLVVRLAKVIGTAAAGDMLEDWMNALDAGTEIVCARDQVLSPVHVDDVVRALTELACGSHTGLFHVAGPDVLTRWDLLQLLIGEVARFRAVDPRVRACRLAELKVAEPRPCDSSMSSAKLREILGFDMRDMRSACAAAAGARYALRGR